jgi:hypothetical protein
LEHARKAASRRRLFECLVERLSSGGSSLIACMRSR